MKDLYKNPMLYYIGVPVLLAAWPLCIGTRYLPAAQKDLAKWKGYMPDVNSVAGEILRLDPERLDDKATTAPEQFDYTTAIGRAASLCSIPSTNWSYNTGIKTKSAKGQQSETATVTLRGVGIVQVCQFLSRLQQSWPHLECTSINLTQDKKVADRWDAKVDFVYFY